MNRVVFVLRVKRISAGNKHKHLNLQWITQWHTHMSVCIHNIQLCATRPSVVYTIYENNSLENWQTNMTFCKPIFFLCLFDVYRVQTWFKRSWSVRYKVGLCSDCSWHSAYLSGTVQRRGWNSRTDPAQMIKKKQVKALVMLVTWL